MSLKSWKQEFYPITALQAAKTLDTVGLVEHAIQKWIGLQKKNLDKHEMDVGYREIYESGNVMVALNIDAHTCSLCRKFVDRRLKFSDGACVGCPIYESRGKVRCFEYHESEKTPQSPWGMWGDRTDPEPMIRALRKALKWAKEHQG